MQIHSLSVFFFLLYYDTQKVSSIFPVLCPLQVFIQYNFDILVGKTYL